MKSTSLAGYGRARLVILMLGLFQAAAHWGTALAQTALVTYTTSGALTITTNIAVPASSGITYVLQKAASGKLTLDGQITGGSGSILRTTTDTSGDAKTIIEFAAANSAYSGSIQLWRGVVQVDNAAALGTGTVYCDGNASVFGDLTFGASVVFTNSFVLQESDTLSSSNFNVILTGGISDGGGGFGITKYGTGMMTLSGSNTYGGATVIGGSGAAGGTLALGSTNALPSGTALTIDNRSGASVLNFGGSNPKVGTITFYAGGAVRTNIIGSGTLVLSGNLTLVDPHVVSGGQDYALAVNALLDLNGATRVFAVGYGNNAESSDLGDLHLNGTITNSSGTAGVTFTNWLSGGTNFDGSVTLGAANTYNGPTILDGGTGSQGTSTLALNANNAIPNNSAFIQSPNTILDLTAWGKTTGITTGMGSLTGAGTITLGSTSVLTIGYDNTSPAPYAGAIGGSNGVIIKTGNGTLTFSGTNTYTGSTTVKGGTLLINGMSTGSAVTVASGATLSGSGTITTNVTVSNGATLTAGNGTGVGTLTLNSLTLGANPADAVTVNGSGALSGITGAFNVVNVDGLTNNGIVTVNINGTLPGTAPAVYNLITYSGAVQGSGTFTLGTVPVQTSGYITNNASANAIQFVVTSGVPTPAVTWEGVPTNSWDLNGSNVWKQTAAGAPTSYTNGDLVTFDDTAANFLVNVATTVSPGNVTISNNANSYIFAGNGSIAGLGLTKTGSGTVTLSTSNSYAGGTVISAGTVILGTVKAIPSGNVSVNGTLDVHGLSPTLDNLSGSGLVDNVSAAGSPVLNLAASSASTFSGTIQNTSGSLALNLTGSSTLILTGTNTYTGGTVLGGPLQIGAGGSSGTIGSGPVTDNSVLTFDRTDTNTFSNNINGTGTIQQNGSGTVNLTGSLNYNGGLVVNAGALRIGSLILAGDTTSGGGLGATYTNSISIAAGAVLQSSGTLSLYESSTLEPFIGVSGAGTLLLTGTGNNAINSPDISFAANDTIANSTANWGDRIASPVNLGNAQRYIWGSTDHTSVDVYGVLEADCQFGGQISGAGGMTFMAQNNSSGSDGLLMETPFCLNASNNFTGPVFVQRGSVYLGAANAFPAGNVLQFNVAAGNSGKFFLYGHNTTISDLASTNTGTAVIADGNRNPSSIGPATLTITQNNPETYAGGIVDTNVEYAGTAVGSNTVLSVIKAGSAALTLTGPVTFSGTMAVNAGKLYVNTTSSGGGAVTVNNGGTLGGNGVITAVVTVSNGAALEAGGGQGLGTLSLKSLVLGANPASDTVTLSCEAIPSGINNLSVQNVNGLTNNATVTVNITGVLPALAPTTYTLVSYAGSIQGGGSFVLGSTPDQAVAYLTNNAAASAIQLVVSSVTIPSVTWIGSPTNDWDLLGGDIWKQTGTSVLSAYADNDEVVFDDTAANSTVNLAVSVAPNGVLITNNLLNYVIGGNGAISGYTGLTKQGAGTVTLVAANNYTGNTTITAGKLVLGVSGAIPGGTGYGNVQINGALDVNGQSPTLNNLSGSGLVDNVSAAGSPVLNVDALTATTFGGTLQNTTGSLELNLTGNSTLTLAGTNTYTGITTINNGTLQIGAGGTSGILGSGAVMDLGTLAFNRSDSNAVPNDIAGTGGLAQNGAGIIDLTGNLTYTGPTVVNAGTLIIPSDVTFDAGSGTTLTVASNAVMESGFVLSLNANPSSVAVDIGGLGTVKLVSAIDRIESFPDLTVGANNNGVSTANYGVRLAAGLDVGLVQRLVWAISSEDDVARYGLSGCDFQFAGPISGTAELTLLGKNSWTGVNTMEEQFALTAANTAFTGPLEVQRGSVYLGNSNALTAGNVLILDPAASVNSRLFLYGYNASVSDLQSGGYGNMLIANGNNLSSTNVGPATLTVTENNPTTFAGDIMDWYTEYTAPVTGSKLPVLSFVKNGPSALTLTGASTYSGTTVINAGKLYFNNSATGGGAVTVNANGTLGGSGFINSPVTLKNGGAIETGDGTGTGNLQLSALALGSATGDHSILNLTPDAQLNVTNNNGLVLNGGAGSVTINVGGTIASLGAVPLISYQGALGGSGFAAFLLGSTPAGASGYLSNDTANASIDFVATQVTVPRWSGAFSSEWSTNILTSPKNWVLDSDGVTPLDYLDGENVKFEDGAVNPVVNISVANVSPLSATFSNAAQNYAIGGAYGITGAGKLTKLGGGKVTLSTTNSYTGITTVSAGTLALGTAAAIPGGAGKGNVVVNGTLDIGGFSPILNNLSGSGIVDDLTAGGSPVLTVNDSSSPVFSGSIKNTSGVMGLTLTGAGTLTLAGINTYKGSTVVGSGILVVNGSLAGGAVTLQNGAALGGSGSIAGPVIATSGTALNLMANLPLTVGPLALNGTVSVNVSGNVSVSNSATYVLLNHGAKTGAGSYLLGPVPGISSSGYTATLNDTNNQLLLVVAPTQPTGTIADVKHVIIFMQENRSFDHYFGSLHGVHGFSDHVTLTFTNGSSDLYQPSGSSYELPFHSTVPCLSDLAHDWSSTHEGWNSGKWNQWVAAKGTETMAYYNRSDLSYYYSLADNFTICDEYHCSVMSSTDPNRVSFMTGMIDPTDLGGGPLIDNTEPANGWGTNWVTYPELLQKAGVSWKVYQASDNYDDNALNWFAAYKDAPVGSALYNSGETFAPSIVSGSGFQADYTNLITEIKTAISNNTLPSVSWIIGPDVGSEHPSWSPGDGEILTKGLLDALASNPKIYNSTVFILNYDENDGFFDHAVPINPPTGTTNEFVSGLPIGLGVRVPCIIVSPWTRGGYVCSQVFDHSSVIRFLEKWTGVQEPNISAWRRQVCGDLTSAFDFAHPNTNYPTSLTLATENDCASGTTATPPAQQTVPAQESGTLLERPLPYQPNVIPVLNSGAGTLNLLMTNSGSVSVHFSVYANAYRNDGPWPFDVVSSNTVTTNYSLAASSGNYDFSSYGPNGFLRRFAGNLNADSGKIEAISYLNPSADSLAITLANPGSSPVVFSVTNGYFSNSLATYTVPAFSTNVLDLDASTNNGWYDLTAIASSDPLFVRRFAGHIETNGLSGTLVSSENASGYKDNVIFTAALAGFGTPTGTVQFETNGIPIGSPVALANGVASLSTATLPRGTNVIVASYSGDALNQAAIYSLWQVVTNHPPVAGPAYYSRAAGVSLLVNISTLLTNVTDIDGDPITLVGVGTDGLNRFSTNGASLLSNGTYLLYTNSVTPNVNDGFLYTVTDGQGGTNQGNLSIIMNNNVVGQSNVKLAISSTNVTANFFGVPGFVYIVDRSTNLMSGAGWVPISTNTAPANGLIQVLDNFQDLGVPIPPAPSPVFYRLRYDP